MYGPELVEQIIFGHDYDGIASILVDDKRLNLHDFELMKYTGLTDKHGKEIYEGDILKFSVLVPCDPSDFQKVLILPVAWDKVAVGFSPFVDGYDIDYETIEIIGNIFENRELLEEIA